MKTITFQNMCQLEIRAPLIIVILKWSELLLEKKKLRVKVGLISFFGWSLIQFNCFAILVKY